jgi:LacI family transcriptional regulator
MGRRRKTQFGPTQKDIADALGLAQSTVAVALSDDNESKLMQETVTRIREYAAKIGYRPQRFAQIMRGGRTKVVGVIVRMGLYSSNHELVRRLANALNRAGYRLVMVDMQWFDENLAAVKDYLVDQAVEGVIMCNVVSRALANELRSLFPAALPFLSLNSGLEGAPDFRVDTQAAFHQLTRYHLALGAKRLVCLSMFRDPGMLSRPAWSTWDRVAGFVQGIQEAGGIVVSDEDVRKLLEIPGSRESVPQGYTGIVGEVIYPEKPAYLKDAYEHGFHQTLKLLGRQETPDSLICMNDDAALGALAACADCDVKAPENLRITGYDDTPAGRFGSVPLTTVRKPLDELAEKAVLSILSRIQEPEKPGSADRIFLPGEIVIRGSSAAPEENARLAKEGFFATGEAGARFDYSPRVNRLGLEAPSDPQFSANLNKPTFL